MATEFRLPELGENLESVEVTAVLVAPGDRVAKDQPVVEVETEKASLEVPAPFAGVVEAVRVAKGDRIEVGAVLITLAADATGEQPPSEERAPAAVEEPEAGKVVRFSRPPGAAPALATAEPVPAAPSVRRLARELGLDIRGVTGRGPGGRISADDVKRRAKELLTGAESGAAVAPAAVAATLPDFERWGEVEREPLQNVRRATVRNMARAWALVPHVTQFDHADVTELDALRDRLSPRVERSGAKLTITAIVLKAAAGALRKFPRFNASLDTARGEAVLKKYVHLGVAVDTDRGLLVPVIRDVDRKNIAELAVELGELASRARDKKIAPEDLQGASFTVTNLGGLGTTYFSPIVNWPEVAILGVGRAEIRPVWRDGSFQPRQILPLSISYDHRWIDGADAARFVRWIAEALEQPLLLSLEG